MARCAFSANNDAVVAATLENWRHGKTSARRRKRWKTNIILKAVKTETVSAARNLDGAAKEENTGGGAI